MPSILSLVTGFQKGFDAKIHSARLYEAFKEIDKLLTAAGLGSSSGLNFARVYSSANVTTVTAVAKIIPFDKTQAQVGDMHSDSSQNSRLTCFRAGIYTISAHVQWPATNAGERIIQILLNGGTIIASQLEISPAAAAPDIDQSVTTSYFLNTGDYIEIQLFQNSGGNIVVVPVGNYSLEAFIGEH